MQGVPGVQSASSVHNNPPNMTAASTVQLSLPQPTLIPSPAFYGVAVGSPPPPVRALPPHHPSNNAKWISCSNLNLSVSNVVSHAAGKANATILDLEDLVLQCVNGGANVREPTSRLLDEVITSIDIGSFCGKDQDLRESKFSNSFIVKSRIFANLGWNKLPLVRCHFVQTRKRKINDLTMLENKILPARLTIFRKSTYMPTRGCH